jgi:hypothetical protein
LFVDAVDFVGAEHTCAAAHPRPPTRARPRTGLGRDILVGGRRCDGLSEQQPQGGACVWLAFGSEQQIKKVAAQVPVRRTRGRAQCGA